MSDPTDRAAVEALIARLAPYASDGRGRNNLQNVACLDAQVALTRLIDDRDAAIARAEAAERGRRRDAHDSFLQATLLKAVRDHLTAENARLRSEAPGDMFWLAEDPEYPQECWSTPIEERWEKPGTVFEIMCAKSLPHIFVTERALTVDDHGDPDETEAAWFYSKAEADAEYARRLLRLVPVDVFCDNILRRMCPGVG